MGWLSSHPEGAYIRDLLGRAEYVVWSYNTPIGFVSLGDGEVQRFYVDEHHTPTTSQHQSVLKAAWGEYETIGERRPVRRAVVGRPQTASIQELGSRRLGPSLSRDQMDWSAQDDLMDEVSSYTRAHP
jgi:hypothetical protein